MTEEPILTDAALKRIANADISGEHSLMARELRKWRTGEKPAMLATDDVLAALLEESSRYNNTPCFAGVAIAITVIERMKESSK